MRAAPAARRASPGQSRSPRSSPRPATAPAPSRPHTRGRRKRRRPLRASRRTPCRRAARALRWLTNGSRDVVSESSPEGLIWHGYKWRYLKSDKHDRTGRPSPSNREYGREHRTKPGAPAGPGRRGRSAQGGAAGSRRRRPQRAPREMPPRSSARAPCAGARCRARPRTLRPRREGSMGTGIPRRPTRGLPS